MRGNFEKVSQSAQNANHRTPSVAKPLMFPCSADNIRSTEFCVLSVLSTFDAGLEGGHGTNSWKEIYSLFVEIQKNTFTLATIIDPIIDGML